MVRHTWKLLASILNQFSNLSASEQLEKIARKGFESNKYV